MMKKFVKFCEKPLTIISASVFSAFLILVIVLACIPYVGRYTYHNSTFGINMDIVITLNKSKSKLTETVTVTGLGEDQKETVSASFKVKNGTLYTYGEGVEEGSHKVGKINAFRIEFDSSQLGAEYEVLLSSIVLKNKATCALRDLSISMIVIFFVTLACSVALTVMDKKGVLKIKDKSEGGQEAAGDLPQEDAQPQVEEAQMPQNENPEQPKDENTEN